MKRMFLLLALFVAFGVRSSFAACTFVAASAPAFDAKTYHVGGEATVPATGTTQNCTFTITTLPSSGTVVALQGTITFRSSCAADALSTVSFNGSTKYYSSAIKIGNSGGAQTIFINYTVPLSFTSSGASITLSSNVASGCSAQGDWELQSTLELQ